MKLGAFGGLLGSLIRLPRIVSERLRAPQQHDMHAQSGRGPEETPPGMSRTLLRKEKPVTLPWRESVGQWAQRAGKCVGRMNAEYDLDGLCRRFFERLRKLEEAKGERLRP